MRLLVVFSVIGACLLAAVNVLARRWLEPDSAAAVLAAGVICLASATMALAPAAVIAPRSPGLLVPAALAAILIRIGLTLACGLAYWYWLGPPQRAFTNAMVASYLTLLAAETALLSLVVTRHWRQPHSS